MKTTLINTANMDIKTGEIYTKLLPYNAIVNDEIIHELWYMKCQGSGYRLRHCQAWVIEMGMYQYLISYNTVVAMIDRQTGILYDFLRVVYGYTLTSAQHISKFYNDSRDAWSIYRYVSEG